MKHEAATTSAHARHVECMQMTALRRAERQSNLLDDTNPGRGMSQVTNQSRMGMTMMNHRCDSTDGMQC